MFHVKHEPLPDRTPMQCFTWNIAHPICFTLSTKVVSRETLQSAKRLFRTKQPFADVLLVLETPEFC